MCSLQKKEIDTYTHTEVPESEVCYLFLVSVTYIYKNEMLC